MIMKETHEKLINHSNILEEDGQEALDRILDYLLSICKFDNPDETMMRLADFINYFQAKHILDQAILETESNEE